MGEMVKELPPKYSGTRKYAWDQWFNGKPWKLDKGTDFQLAVYSFRHACFIAAACRDMRIEVRIVGNSLYLQAFKLDRSKLGKNKVPKA